MLINKETANKFGYSEAIKMNKLELSILCFLGKILSCHNNENLKFVA
jgi:hypothetical protein